MLIKIDTREQLPYSFIIPSEVGTLPIGDYSISGLEHNISIERKTLDDLVGCLTQQRKRFERELFRGKALDYFTLVVEGSLSDIQMRKYFSKTPSEAVIQSLLAFSVRYRLPVFFCENRKFGERVTESLLCKFAREIEKQGKALTQQNESHRR